jgi:polysaccharide biosynthesis protein PslG
MTRLTALTASRATRDRTRIRRVLAGATAAAVAATVVGAGPAAWADRPTDRPAAPKAAAATSYASVGVQFHGMWNMYTDAQRKVVLDKLTAAGVQSVRLDVSWAMLQPTGPNSYDAWGVGFVDKVINMAYARGIKPLVLLRLTPGWANRGQSEDVLPDNPADYARVARWAAARWNGKVLGWEVWNEQNSPDFMAGADPVAYVRLLKAAYPAFKAGSPSAQVVFGGMQYNDTEWIRRAYAAGAKGSFDVMATHPYLGPSNLPPSTPDNGTMWTLKHVKTVRDLMVARGDGAKPIWFTELGWSTHANPAGYPPWALGVSEATQAAYLTQTVSLVRAQYPYVTRMYWYNERDLPWGGVHVENYGLLHRDLSAKPALGALAAANGVRPATRKAVPPAARPAAAASNPKSSQPSVSNTGLRHG